MGFFSPLASPPRPPPPDSAGIASRRPTAHAKPPHGLKRGARRGAPGAGGRRRRRRRWCVLGSHSNAHWRRRRRRTLHLWAARALLLRLAAPFAAIPARIVPAEYAEHRPHVVGLFLDAPLQQFYAAAQVRHAVLCPADRRGLPVPPEPSTGVSSTNLFGASFANGPCLKIVFVATLRVFLSWTASLASQTRRTLRPPACYTAEWIVNQRRASSPR